MTFNDASHPMCAVCRKVRPKRYNFCQDFCHALIAFNLCQGGEDEKEKEKKEDRKGQDKRSRT
jgi:hypothetical protein